MTVTVRQIKNKDGTITSDVNGALRVLKETNERWFLPRTKRKVLLYK